MADSTGPLQAVGHPVRLRVLQRLAGGEVASVPELADAAGAHENTVRAHVAVLEEAGLIAGESRPAAGPGRPGVQYRLTERGERLDQDFLGLAELLAAALGRTGLQPEQLQDVGREWGRYLAGRPGQYDPRERLPEILRRLGYDVAVDGEEVRLTGCPSPQIAPDPPRMLCEQATRVVDGVHGAAGSPLRTGPAEHDPPRRDCRITLVER
jgi:predicted ArsR family transcriptional regulator